MFGKNIMGIACNKRDSHWECAIWYTGDGHTKNSIRVYGRFSMRNIAEKMEDVILKDYNLQHNIIKGIFK